MNCIAGMMRGLDCRISGLAPISTATMCRLMLPMIASLALGACGAPVSEAQVPPPQPAALDTEQIAQAEASATEPERNYEIDYIVTPDPEAANAKAEMVLRQDSSLLRELDLFAPESQFSSFSGDGEIVRDGDRLVWQPPANGGTLRWIANIRHQRNNESYDAYITDDWAIFRAEDVIPRAAVRSLRGARSVATLSFRLPAGWSSVTEYFGRDDHFKIENEERRFIRPAGWILLGKIGVRHEKIADVRVNVAAPVGHGLRRMDIIALLGWSLPEIVRIFPDFPQRLTIIGATDPMWRGGLSGPRSLFMHADRPLLSENATSSILHEIVHVALGRGANPDSDWIVEGLSEYYGLLVLRRSGTISAHRHQASLRELREWGQESDNLCARQSSGATTARAVSVFADVDAEIQRGTAKAASLDDVIRALAGSDSDITISSLRATARQVLGADVDSLAGDNLPGCEN